MGLSPNLPDSLKGPLWMLWSCLVFVAVWGLIRYLSASIHPFVIVFYRTLFGILAFAPFLMRHGIDVMRTNQLPLHAVRGVFSFLGTLGLFYAVAHVALADVVAISYAAPVFAAVGAILVLKEKVRWRRIVAIAIGFLGVMVVLRPGFRELTPGVWAALLGSFALSGSLVAIKRLAGTDRPEVIALYAFLFVLPGSLIVAAFFWSWPDWDELMLLGVMGVLVGLGHTALARAFVHAEATAVLPFDFSRIVFASILGFVAFAEPVDGLTWLGAALVLGATVYVAHREAQMARAEKASKVIPPPPPGS